MKAPVGGLLYSLLHLGGFPNDLAFYSGRCGSGRILEMGCGDGRLGVHICLGESPLSVLQQTLRQEADRQTGNAPAQDVGNVLQQQFMPPKAYVGIELCEPLALKAQKRLGAVAEAEVIVGDFLTTLLEKDTASFDTALVSANTLFATPKHGELLAQCANALRPGGVLLLDVYNALPWHPEEGGGRKSAATRAKPMKMARVETAWMWAMMTTRRRMTTRTRRRRRRCLCVSRTKMVATGACTSMSQRWTRTPRPSPARTVSRRYLARWR